MWSSCSIDAPTYLQQKCIILYRLYVNDNVSVYLNWPVHCTSQHESFPEIFFRILGKRWSLAHLPQINVIIGIAILEYFQQAIVVQHQERCCQLSLVFSNWIRFLWGSQNKKTTRIKLNWFSERNTADASLSILWPRVTVLRSPCYVGVIHLTHTS